MKKEYLFLLKIKDSNDRDCVVYMDNNNERIRVCGACFSSNLKSVLNDNENNLETILNKDEIQQLINIEKEENNCFKDYTKEHKQFLQKIINKLESDDNKKLFDKVIQEEKEWCMNEYNLSSNDIDDIFNNYGLDYRDRGIIDYVYEDAYELGERTINECYNIDAAIENYIDYERFGEDIIVNGDGYYELSDGRIVEYN